MAIITNERFQNILRILIPIVVFAFIWYGYKKKSIQPKYPIKDYSQEPFYPGFYADTAPRYKQKPPFYGGGITTSHPRISKNYDYSLVESHYPFFLYNDGSLMIGVEIDTDSLDTKYTPIFEKYDYSGTGVHWSNLIIQILEKKDPELLHHLDFDPESGGFYVFTDNRASQKRFIQILVPIFTNTARLEAFLKQANRERMLQ
jgi:hypothetical protein